MSQMRDLIEKLTAISEDRPTVGDGVFLEFGSVLEVDTEILELGEDSVTLLADEKLFSMLESLDAFENQYLGEARLWRARDFGGKNYINHFRDDYFIATSAHEGDDVKKTNYHLLKKTVKTDDEMTPAYEEITTLNVSPYKTSRDEIHRAAEAAIEKTENVNEARYEIHHIDQDGKTKAIQHHGDDYSDDTIRKDARYLQKNNPKSTIKVYKDKKPFDYKDVNEGEVVSLQDNPQTIKKIVKMWWNGSEDQHARASKMLQNMGWDVAEDEDDIVLNKGDKEIRFWMDDLHEAEYHGRKVPLGKPMRGDVKKFKVFVKDPKTGNVKKVNFGDKKMRIKKSNPKRRKSFRARHNCANPGPRTKARYWSCRKW